MSKFNALAWALAKSSGDGVQNAFLRRLCEAVLQPVTDEMSNEELAEIASNAIDVWEHDPVSTEDALGTYVVHTKQSNVVSGDAVFRGVLRLKAGHGSQITPPKYFVYSGQDLSNLTSTRVGDFARLLLGDTMYVSLGLPSASRLILPETWPVIYNDDGKTLVSYNASCPAKVYLSKHFGAHVTVPNFFNQPSDSRFTEEVVVAPKDMDAQWHLHRFTKMTVATIVAILENLADVTEREDSYTLTLGASNLAMLTDEQKNIAIEKGWNLA